jgi:hypothetical protein
MTNAPLPIRFESIPASQNLPLTETLWQKAQNAYPHSFFTSWGWLETWLQSLPSKIKTELLLGYTGEDLQTACLLSRRKTRKFGILPTRSLALHSTGIPYYDSLYIEYNGILADSPSLLRADLLQWVDAQPWDEWILPGLAESFVEASNLLTRPLPPGWQLRLEEKTPTYFVELEKIRSAGMDFLKLLSANRRSQIRRSVKEYEQRFGEIKVQEAQNKAEAQEIFQNLVRLHQAEWQRRGKPGAFSNKYLHQFHQDLIARRFDAGEIQLLRVYTPQGEIGCLYNFLYQGRALFYQSGFAYQEENVYRPGLVSHYFAILHNAQKETLQVYDFLAGDSQYKSSLSTNSTQMYWVRIVRGKERLALENAEAWLKTKVQAYPGLQSFLKTLKRKFFSRS